LNPPDTDPDEDLLRDALRSVGVDAHVRAWDDPSFDVGAFDLAVVRSTWNYYRTPERFLAWCDAAAARTRLANPPDIIRTNAHKSYLRSMERAGLPIVPTAWVDKRTRADLHSIMRTHGWDDVVVKPAISAGSWRTKRFRASETAEGGAFLAEIASDADAMIQKYIPSVERGGERSIMWIGGEITHAIIKNPRFAGHEERVDLAAPPTHREREMLAGALSGMEDRLLYARLDVMADADGAPIVSELELIEPSLFLREHPPALERMVTAIALVGRR